MRRSAGCFRCGTAALWGSLSGCRRLLAGALLPTALLLATPTAAEIIDRIAVTIDKHVITESEILRQVRITAFINGEKPVFSSENKRRTADRLVEQTLIRREIETSRYPTEAASKAQKLHEQLRKRYPSDLQYRKALAEYEITAEDVEEALEWQATLLEFIEVRFRPGVQIPENELKDYFATEVVAKGEKISFEEAREQIESILTQQRVDNALDRWLGQARTQARIRFRREVFQ
jgi:hypothetical protein